MSADYAAARLDTIHESLSGLLADMMGSAAGRSAPAPHVSFFALGVREPQALELIQVVNAVFGLHLPADTVLRIRAQGLQAGDQRIMVQVNTDDVKDPIRREESTRVFGDQ